MPAVVAADEPQVLKWSDLIPLQERSATYSSAPPARPLFDDETGPPAAQVGSSAVNQELDRKQVQIVGFVVPLDIAANGRVSEFLLVPYFGACIHVPPPPPNQIVYVRMRKPFRLHTLYAAVWVTGTMSTKGKSSDLSRTAYSLDGTGIENYREPESAR